MELKPWSSRCAARKLFGTQFGAQVWERGKQMALTDADIVATVTAFTAESIARSHRDFAPAPIDDVYLAGGGALNPTLVEMIRARLAH